MAENIELRRARALRYYHKNKEKYAQYKEDNKDKIKEYLQNYYQDNKERLAAVHKSYAKEWSKNNRPLLNAKEAKRRFSKKNATPIWLSSLQLEEIENIYELSKEVEMLTGDKYHVDHIVPLNGKNVCGLHVPWNLQILPAEDNIRKGNRL